MGMFFSIIDIYDANLETENNLNVKLDDFEKLKDKKGFKMQWLQEI